MDLLDKKEGVREIIPCDLGPSIGAVRPLEDNPSPRTEADATESLRRGVSASWCFELKAVEKDRTRGERGEVLGVLL